MKKINISLLVMLLLAGSVYSQGSNVINAWNYRRHGELDKAKQAIDEACTHEGSKDEAKTWLYRGQIYNDIASSKKADLASLKPGAYEEATKAYIKCIQLDEKKSYTEDSYKGLLYTISSLYNDAAQSFNDKKYDAAGAKFEVYLSGFKVLQKEGYFSQLDVATKSSILRTDTSSLYYIGQSAYLANNNEKAKTYFNSLIDEYKYKEPAVFLTMAEIYKSEKDTVKALNVLEKGMAQAKDKKNIIRARLAIFLREGKLAQAMDECKKALALEPDNMDLQIELGSLYQVAGKNTEASDIFQKILAKDPNNFNANKAIGNSFYNMGADLYNRAIDMKDEKQEAKAEAESKDDWRKALPFLEKAHQITPRDIDVKTMLVEIYAKLGNMDMAKKIKSE